MYRFVEVNARKAYARVTQSRVTIAFFVFSFIYCCAQIILQCLFLSVDSKYVNLFSGIIEDGNLPPANFTYFQGNKGDITLQMCNDIPFGRVHPCTTIYDSTWDLNLTTVHVHVPQVLEDWGQNLTVTRTLDPSNVTQVLGVQIEPNHGSIINLSEQCVRILLYPHQLLHHFKDEDTISLCLQIWLLGISFVIVLYGSVPHTVAALIMRTLATGWTMYTAWRGPTFAANFQELIAGRTSPCSLDVFSTYWKTREVYEVIDLTLSSSGLLILSYLSWKLLRTYNGESVKCVGAPLHVVRIQKFFMALLSTLYLEVFVLIASFGLWHKNLYGTTVDHMSAHTPIYKVMYIISVALLLPWIAMGWYSIRHEMKRMMVTFLGIGFAITVGWSILFSSNVYRWSFVQWPYLACYTVVSFFLLLASMVLGIICRMNFDKGLAHYLHAESTLASLNFAPGVFSHDTTVISPTSTTISGNQSKELDLDAKSRVYFITSLPKEDNPEHQQLSPSQNTAFALAFHRLNS